MKRVAYLWLACWWLVASLHAQQNPPTGRTLVVIPFENTSPTPGLEWLGEAFPVSFRSQLDSPILYVASREERLRAYDRQGVPSGVHPSRATIYRLAEQMDVDYAVLGSYSYNGASLTATAQLLDMRAQKILPPITESATLSDLANLQSALAWDLVRLIRSNFGVPKDRYIAGVPPMRLDALENYVGGILASTADEKIQHYREAVRLNPVFSEAWLELGKTYYAQRQYEQSIAALEKVPENAKVAREACFYLGLSSYAHGDFDQADQAFEFVAARLPLAEVYNNLGVVADRRGQKRASDDFERAIQNDPSDPDYHFNLAVAESRSGDKARAARELRIVLDRKPNDQEARAFLDSLMPPAIGAQSANAASMTPAKLPPERLNRNYEENAFRQMTIQMQSWAEQQFARSDPRSHARYHIELGKELLAHGFTSEAETEFRHAAAVDPSSPVPLAALADVYDARGDSAEARAEAEASLRVHESVEAYLVLARLDLRENRTDAATENVNRVLQIEPRNLTAQDLKRTLAAKLAEKAQPLPQE
ncbi:MAG: tetratricopeptide repeat protein [Terriglobales bacterium]